MAKFIDQHPMTPFSAEQLRKAQQAPEDEFGVTHHDLLYNAEENKLWCVLNAPDEKAVAEHHAKLGPRASSIGQLLHALGGRIEPRENG